MRYVNDKEEARSIMNQGFFKVFKNLKSFNQDYDFLPWFKTIMINASLDYLRKHRKQREYERHLEDQVEEHAEDPIILNHINFKDLISIISKLTPAYRSVFNLYVIDGYKHEEIAEKLNITVGTSKSNLSRAKLKLRELLTENLVSV